MTRSEARGCRPRRKRVACSMFKGFSWAGGECMATRRRAVILVVSGALALGGSATALAATFNGTALSDTTYGTQKADTVNGKGGDDTLRGLGGKDKMDGGSGDDYVNGDGKCAKATVGAPYYCLPG